MKGRIFLLCILLSTTIQWANAQLLLDDAKVASPAYDEMLQGLLSHTVTEVGVKEILELEEPAIFLDAREWKEYEVSHIKDAVWIGYDDFNAKRLKGLDKSDKIIVYCSVGYRSEKITEKLEKMGYEDVANFYGSLFEWMNQGQKVYDTEGKETQRIHAYDEHWGQWVTNGEKVFR